MATEPRIIRNKIEPRDTSKPPPTSREIQRYERIIAMGQIALAAFGTENVTIKNLAIALGMAPLTIRRHFPDIHSLLNEILTRHILGLSAALGEIPFDTPNRAALQRRAYLDYTRGAFNKFTEPHLLLVRDAHLLPEDLRTHIELAREAMGDLLAGPSAGREALVLLDIPYLTAERIESMLAPILPQSHAAQTEPAKPPAAKRPTPAPTQPNPLPPDPAIEKPGAWIFTCGIPTTARAPPA